MAIWYFIHVKLSEYAKQMGVTYKTAHQWWRAGQLVGFQLPTGTIIVREPKPAAAGAALYARVSSADEKDDLTRQVQRLRDYAAARGYQVIAEVTEIASGLIDERPKLKKLLANAKVDAIVVEYRDRLARFGYGSIAALLEHEGGRWTISWPLSRAWPRVSMAVAMRSAERRRSRRASNGVSNRQTRHEYDPARVQN